MTSHHTDGAHAAPGTEGLGALDRERAASLADEGGTAAAAMEAREDPLVLRTYRFEEGSWRTAAVMAIGTAIAWLVLRRH